MEESKGGNTGQKQSEIVDMGLAILMELKESDLAGNPAQHRDTV